MNYNEIYKVIDPQTLKIVEVLDMNEWKCYSGQCGGCVDCLLRQAIHWGFIIKKYFDDFISEEEFTI